ncbi:uncharacterized protein LOC133530872 [Cydia pomonella]|uniref:uncharacterized protein LOC133530872 n=1 Tax=Cydia pomonella TaxID=82600 RepID=UPI002ADE87DA|nr:uncharacterized protein LOC133530872 [Cydia pomonella]
MEICSWLAVYIQANRASISPSYIPMAEEGRGQGAGTARGRTARTATQAAHKLIQRFMSSSMLSHHTLPLATLFILRGATSYGPKQIVPTLPTRKELEAYEGYLKHNSRRFFWFLIPVLFKVVKLAATAGAAIAAKVSAVTAKVAIGVAKAAKVIKVVKLAAKGIQMVSRIVDGVKTVKKIRDVVQAAKAPKPVEESEEEEEEEESEEEEEVVYEYVEEEEDEEEEEERKRLRQRKSKKSRG